MIPFIRLAALNAVRNGRRTALTAATVAVGTAFTVITLSLLGGIMDKMVADWADIFGPVRVVTADFAEREAVQPLHFNIAEVAPVLEKVRAVEGVDQAEPVIRTGVILAVGEEIGEDAGLMVGSTPEWFERVIVNSGKLTSGAWLTNDDDGEQVVLGGKIARDIGAKVGDNILIMGTTQFGSMAPISADVVGVITGNSSLDSQVYVSLETARWMVDVPEGALEILVYPSSDSRSALEPVAQGIRKALGEDYHVEAWIERGMWKAQLPTMDAMEWVISFFIVFIMALAIFNTMTMSVLERTNEIGVMRAMGQSRRAAVTSFLAEALVIGVGGGIVGVLLGSGPAIYFENTGIQYSQDLIDDMGADFPIASTMYGDFSVEVVAVALFCGVLTAALGALLPAMRAARIQPYEAMRAKR